MSLLNTNVLYIDTSGKMIDTGHDYLDISSLGLRFTPAGNIISYANGNVTYYANHFHFAKPDPIVKYWNINGISFKTKLVCLHGGEIYVTKVKQNGIWAYILQGYDISLDWCYSKAHAKIINKLLKRVAHLDKNGVKTISSRWAII